MKKKEKQECYEWLKDRGYFDSECILTKNLFCKLFRLDDNIEYEDWRFKGPFMEFMVYLEQRGICNNTKGLEKGWLRILPTNMNAINVIKKTKRNHRQTNRFNECLINTNTNNFSKKDLDNLMHALNVVTATARALKSTLSDL